MSCDGTNSFLISCAFLLLLAHSVWADVVVQLNINRPINDVSDKFISFTLKPEDLYKALDSSNRKTITRMASMLSQAHVKFIGDFNFAAKTNAIRLKNPTKIFWKGFNKWTKAVNWSMIIPVPYKPNDWDPMQTLTILNTSQMVGIDEAIWQFGTNFGSSRALDYVSELKTFNLMVESFRTFNTNWQTMGADISAGSSPGETRRYVDMSRDLNVAYGWIQSEETFSSNSLDTALGEQDPALRVLLKANVPVWLSLPKKKTILTHLEDEVIAGLNWAQTMGDAANVGFETIFKTLSLDDFETPKYDFYVTALFKKIMGSRVYPARPLTVFERRPNKLYTHCANMVSGGLAFMVVNKNEQTLQIAIRPMSRLQDTEVWQYALTMTNGQIMLNNKLLTVNSTLMPEIKRKHNKSMLQLRTPGLSVSFWVLPNANLEHCHFTEVETTIVPKDENHQKIKRYSSTDRLLKELIKESAKPSYSPMAGLFKRQRRSLNNEERLKRFVLEGSKQEKNPLVPKFTQNIMGDIKSPLKEDIFSTDRQMAALQWLSNIFKEPLSFELPQHKRNARESEGYMGPFFLTRDGKKSAFTKKITEIRKPEKKKAPKRHMEEQEFDEEKFFKNVGEQVEPEYVRVPEGDVYLSHIASRDGDSNEELIKIETRKPKPIEPVNEMKPLRLLPTEFFEVLPANAVEPMVTPMFDLGTALNNLLFLDPFANPYGHLNSVPYRKNHYHLVTKETDTHKGLVTDINRKNKEKKFFVKNQNDILKNGLKHKTQESHEEEEKREQQKEGTHTDVKALLDANEPKISEQSTNFLTTHNNDASEDSSKPDTNNEDFIGDDDVSQSKFDEIPWWDLTTKRAKRSIDIHNTPDSWRNNMIPNDGVYLKAANEFSPLRIYQFEQKINEAVRNTDFNSQNSNDAEKAIIGRSSVKTLKAKVAKLMDIVSQHVNEWYNTLTKHLNNPSKASNTSRSNHIF